MFLAVVTHLLILRQWRFLEINRRRASDPKPQAKRTLTHRITKGAAGEMRVEVEACRRHAPCFELHGPPHPMESEMTNVVMTVVTTDPDPGR